MKLYQKVLAGAGGTAGAGYVAWKSMFPWLEDDLKLMKAGRKMKKVREEAFQSLLIDKFEAHAANTPRKVFIEFEDNLYTYEFVDQMACKVANMALSWGLRPKDCVAMMVQNEPAFVWTFLGFQKLGITTALINFNLKQQPLVHSVLAADPKMLIVGSGDSLLESVVEVLDGFGKMKVLAQGLGNNPAPAGIQSWDPIFHQAFTTPVSPAVRAEITLDDISCYIYTSGTTGFPKPVFIQQLKMCLLGLCLQLISLTPEDKPYNPLPLYHSSGIIGFTGALLIGATMVLKKKFSASQFWSDCVKHEVTVIQYIGELFRYLLSQPPVSITNISRFFSCFFLLCI